MRMITGFASLAAIAIAGAAPAAAQSGPNVYRRTLETCPGGQTVRLTAGRRYAISAESTAFDPVLRLFRVGNAEVLAQDDDGGEGNNSLLNYVPAQTGNYRLCVTAFSGGGSGAYVLRVETAPPLPPPVTAPTGSEPASWQIFDGSLGAGDQSDGGAPFDDYQIELAPGERAFISLESAAFDTLLKVYRADQRGGETIATDDDSAGGLNSFLTLTPDGGGTFIVRATSFSSSGTGDYRLRILKGSVPPRPAAEAEGEDHH